MPRWWHWVIWPIALVAGVLVGVSMIPAEFVMGTLAWILGSKDVRPWHVGFVLRQFTDIRYLRAQYPLWKDES